MKAITLIAGIHRAFHVKIPLAKIFKISTIEKLSQYIKGAAKEKYDSIEAVDKKEFYELSSSQKRLFILQQMESRGTAYNIPALMRLVGEVDKKEPS